MAQTSPASHVRCAARPAAWLLALAALLPVGGCGNDASAPSAGAGGQGAGGQSASGQGAGGTECVGVAVAEEAYGRAPGPLAMGEGGAGGAAPSATTLGAPSPTYWLDDVQPLSCAYGATYGLQAFHGAVTVVGLWAGW